MSTSYWRFGISRNIYKGFVAPLLNSRNVENSEGLSNLLMDIHRQLWLPDPRPYRGDAGGKLQELLLGYLEAVINHRKVQFGPVDGVGGDLVVIRGEGWSTTIQMKVAASTDPEQVIKPIQK